MEGRFLAEIMLSILNLQNIMTEEDNSKGDIMKNY